MNSFFKYTAAIVALGSLLALQGQAQATPKKGPASKLYLSETKGSGKIENNGQVYEPKQGTAFDATGTVMMTNKDSHQAYVLSSGTGLYLDANTQVKVEQFDQDRFETTPKTDVEPSISHITIAISRGMVGSCASQMVSGTTLVFSTPLASVNVRGRRVAIQVSSAQTIVSVLEGSVTVRTGDKDGGGVTLQPGERAVIRAGAAGQPPQTVVGPIDNESMAALEGTLTVACNARKTVAFETIDAGTAGEEIVPRPTVTAQPPNNLTVSPDRITPGT